MPSDTGCAQESNVYIVLNLLFLHERDKRLPGWIDHPQLPPLFRFRFTLFSSSLVLGGSWSTRNIRFAMHFSAVFLAGLAITFQTAFAAPTHGQRMILVHSSQSY